MALRYYSRSKGGLENYLNRCVSNGLKNLRRDRYYRIPRNNLDLTGETQSRINLVNALPLGGGDIRGPEESESLCGLPSWDPAGAMVDQEQIELVKSKLTPKRQTDFARVLAGERIPKPRLDQLLRSVKRIVKGLKDGEGE